MFLEDNEKGSLGEGKRSINICTLIGGGDLRLLRNPVS